MHQHPLILHFTYVLLAIEKNGAIAHVDQALAWVSAYFERRNLEVLLQKAARKEVNIDVRCIK